MAAGPRQPQRGVPGKPPFAVQRTKSKPRLGPLALVPKLQLGNLDSLSFRCNSVSAAEACPAFGRQGGLVPSKTDCTARRGVRADWRVQPLSSASIDRPFEPFPGLVCGILSTAFGPPLPAFGVDSSRPLQDTLEFRTMNSFVGLPGSCQQRASPREPPISFHFLAGGRKRESSQSAMHRRRRSGGRRFLLARPPRPAPRPTGKTNRLSAKTRNRLGRLRSSSPTAKRPPTRRPRRAPGCNPSTESGSSTGRPTRPAARSTSTKPTSTSPDGTRSPFRATGRSTDTACPCTRTSPIRSRKTRRG